MNENPLDKCFNLYYLNVSKVYEISMMINNVITTNISKEKSQGMKKSKSLKTSLGGSLEVDSMYLASIKAAFDETNSSEYSSSSKIIENLDIKTTKSILLNAIKERCINNVEISKCNEGDLVKVDDVELSVYNREMLQQMLLLKRDALKGIQVEGIDINNIINSLIKDYSYILIGNKNSKKGKIIIKIPFEIDNEFENNYNVDDVLLGKVSLIGIYKGKNKIEKISSNMINYLSNNQITLNNDDTKVIKSSKQQHSTVKTKTNDEEYYYIDIIAIIQEVKFKEKQMVEKKSWFKTILDKINIFNRKKKNEK